MSESTPQDPIQPYVDRMVEDEIRRSYIIVDLPDELADSAGQYRKTEDILTEAHEIDPAVPVFKRVRFVKLTAKRRRLIDDAVAKQYFEDIQNKARLSKAQIRELNIQRGQWSAEEEKRIEELQESTADLAREIFSNGYDDELWIEELVDLARKFQEWVERRNDDSTFVLADDIRMQLVGRFARWHAWGPLDQDAYTRLYAADQGLETYSVDADAQYLMQNIGSLEAVDWLMRIEELRDRLNDLRRLQKDRNEMLMLQIKQARMYGESPEQRKDAMEEVAKVYYTTEILDDPKKPRALTAKLEDLYNFPEEVMSWLTIESHLFLNSVPREARRYLEHLGFLGAPRRNGFTDASDESPAEQNSKPDTELSEKTEVDSSVSLTATSSTSTK